MSFLPFLVRGGLGVVIASFLAMRGLKKKSLDRSGAAAAWVAGFVTFLAGLRWAAVLVTFYQTSTWLTRYKGNEKKKIEEGYKEGGSRNWEQVFSNAFTGCVLALAYVFTAGAPEVPIDFKADHLSSFLLCAMIGHYACCNGDTWASELGVLSKQPPRLITTLGKVPAGTNGGVTALGLVASTLGGLTVGVVYLVVDAGIRAAFGPGAAAPQYPVIVLATVAGLAGSLLDSLLGANWQYSGWSQTRKRVVNAPGKDVVHLTGLDILTNHNVNFISSLVTAILAGLFAPQLFSAMVAK